MDPDRNVACGHDIEWLLHRRADARLTPEEAALLERRLSGCAACHERAALLDWAVESLREGRKATPEGLTDRVMRRVNANAPTRARRGLPPRLAPSWVAVAAALAIAAGVAVLHRGSAPTQVPTPSAAPALPQVSALAEIHVPAPEASPRVEVVLQLAGGRARTVAVAGDFNAWKAASMTRDEDGVFRVRLSLAPGRYQYAFLVDDSRWTADPRAVTTVDSGFGGNDSVLDLSS